MHSATLVLHTFALLLVRFLPFQSVILEYRTIYILPHVCTVFCFISIHLESFLMSLLLFFFFFFFCTAPAPLAVCGGLDISRQTSLTLRMRSVL